MKIKYLSLTMLVSLLWLANAAAFQQTTNTLYVTNCGVAVIQGTNTPIFVNTDGLGNPNVNIWTNFGTGYCIITNWPFGAAPCSAVVQPYLNAGHFKYHTLFTNTSTDPTVLTWASCGTNAGFLTGEPRTGGTNPPPFVYWNGPPANLNSNLPGALTGAGKQIHQLTSATVTALGDVIPIDHNTGASWVTRSVPVNLAVAAGNDAFNDSTATAFATQQGIADETVRNKLKSQQHYFNLYGVTANIVDWVPFHKMFNPQTGLSYLGRTISTNSLTPTPFGMYFTNGSFARLDGLPDLRTGCVFVVYSRPTPEVESANNFEAFCGFYNPSTLSGEWVVQSPSEHHIGEREGTNLINSVLNSGSGSNPSETNLILAPTFAGGYSFDPSGASGGFNCGLKIFFCYSWSGTNITVWCRWNQCKLNFFNNQFTLGAPVAPQEALTTFKIGGDVMSPSFGQTVLPWSGEVQSVYICNIAANSNLVKALSLASYAVSPETTDPCFVTHSRGLWGTDGNWLHITNGYEYYMVPRYTPYTNSYEQYGISGMDIVDQWNATMSNFLFSIGPFPVNVQRIVIAHFGVNDVYIGGHTPAQINNSMLSFAAAAHQAGCLFRPILDWGIGVNGSDGVPYSSTLNGQVWSASLLMESNSFDWDGFYPANRLMNPFILNSNNTFFVDAVHAQSGLTNGYQIQQAISSSGPIFAPMSIPDFQGNQTNNSKAQLW